MPSEAKQSRRHTKIPSEKSKQVSFEKKAPCPENQKTFAPRHRAGGANPEKPQHPPGAKVFLLLFF
jgi:hypothetical protein